MDAGEFNGCRLYTGLRLDYRLRLWAPMSASCAVSVVVEHLVKLWLLLHSGAYSTFSWLVYCLCCR